MKKEFPWKVLVLVVVGVFVLLGVVFSLTGNTIVANGAWCTDTDNGQNIHIRGECLSSWAPSQQGSDFCIGSQQLTEYYCWGGYLARPKCASQIVTCQRGCKQSGDIGACIDVSE